MIDEYADIINLPHHVSEKHPQMSMSDRAAQFSPFAALSGHDEAIHAVETVSCTKIELDEYVQNEISAKLKDLIYGDKQSACIILQYFIKTNNKNEGVYTVKRGIIKSLDTLDNVLIMDDGTKININDIYSIDIV